MARPNTTTLNENGDGLCGVCKRKFRITSLELCSCCDKWCCSSHRSKSKRITGAYVCSSCKSKGAE